MNNISRVALSLRPPVAMIWLATACLLAACAAVEVVPVGVKDKKTKGLRFYRPRPYVAVRKPFPVGGGEVFLPGTVSGDKITGIAVSRVPEPMRRAFAFDGAGDGASLALSSVRVRKAVTALVDHAATAGAGTKAVDPPTRQQLAGLLKDLSASPSVLETSSQSFSLAATIKKESFEAITAGSLQLGLVPWRDGQADASQFVAVTMPGNPPGDPGKDIKLSGNGLRTSVAGHASWAIAVALVGKRSGDTEPKDYLAHGGRVVMAVVGSTATSTPGSTSTEVQSKGTGSAMVTGSGNPATKPLLKINELFDLVYLPDFDEQYAIQVSGGLGTASADVSLENGWMLEKLSMSIDNRNLGDFLFKQVDKFTDVYRDALKLQSGLLAPAGGETTELSEQSKSALDGQRVLLKLTYVLEAQPGLYPILKPCEKLCSSRPAEARPFYLETPFRPYTVIAWNVVWRAKVELVGSPGGVDGGVGLRQQPETIDKNRLKGALDGTGVALDSSKMSNGAVFGGKLTVFFDGANAEVIKRWNTALRDAATLKKIGKEIGKTISSASAKNK